MVKKSFERLHLKKENLKVKENLKNLNLKKRNLWQ